MVSGEPKLSTLPTALLIPRRPKHEESVKVGFAPGPRCKRIDVKDRGVSTCESGVRSTVALFSPFYFESRFDSRHRSLTGIAISTA